MKKKHKATGKIVNRRAKFDYQLGDSFVVGIVLNGREAKSLRQGHAHLRGAYVTVKGDELWLTNATIASGKTFVIPEDEQTRPRKLLAHRKEIDTMIAARQQGNTLVPTEFHTGSKHIKLRVSVGKGKKKYDKRQTIKERDQKRENARLVR
ncbi:MAG TPA: SsrA-binding protein SmpB [Candidatus Saccharibacteria bacterium]|nr:SsrA-binding protein SmpB [Candidatus Saccharibacteria bacterium]